MRSSYNRRTRGGQDNQLLQKCTNLETFRTITTHHRIFDLFCGSSMFWLLCDSMLMSGLMLLLVLKTGIVGDNSCFASRLDLVEHVLLDRLRTKMRSSCMLSIYR